jgi:hypothetical protein
MAFARGAELGLILPVRTERDEPRGQLVLLAAQDLLPSRSKHLDNLVKTKEGKDRTIAVHRLAVERSHTTGHA